ncbi:hypothetical protein CC1G_09121 [Coprinopsis cinerea okayama7|uniref:Uncharacterized protein n=1 Tax=Coprinopsis cinerea (strain Okayama-7 / 130 / ATCC MYA-4618 / FGSC 9003) TaxID=240176 RepID=A8NJ78_COPC7|nr:hypothetical protein CC1G_09121 [Coprinopsis cinerea okayama7\|eukprot:XP_001834164.2 hypothetical protein CC1G_09121 [Coprinopsis cinerea okayama7\
MLLRWLALSLSYDQRLGSVRCLMYRTTSTVAMCFLCLHAWSRTHEEKGRGAAIRRKNPMRVSPFVIRAHTCSRILRACPNRESNLLCPKPRLFGHPLFADMNKILFNAAVLEKIPCMLYPHRTPGFDGAIRVLAQGKRQRKLNLQCPARFWSISIEETVTRFPGLVPRPGLWVLAC